MPGWRLTLTPIFIMSVLAENTCISYGNSVWCAGLLDTRLAIVPGRIQAGYRLIALSLSLHSCSASVPPVIDSFDVRG